MRAAGRGWVPPVDDTRAGHPGPHRAPIEARLGAALGSPASIKATTNEGMGRIGRGDAIAAAAVAVVARI